MSRPMYGQYRVPEPPSMLAATHLHDGRPLREVDHEPRVAVLDQSDLLAQGIHTSQIVPGAQDVDGLGSCVFNAGTAALSNVLDADAFKAQTGAAYDDAVAAETYAIRTYHAVTDLTGDSQSEWPPTDCGSTGLFLCKALEKSGVIRSHKTATGADNIISLMQDGGLIIGSPWFVDWEEPDAQGFIDGKGTDADLQAAIDSGVAGGHETHWSAIEKLALTATGKVDPAGTIIRGRNSWSASWGDGGSYRCHLSTFVQLAHYADWRLLVA